MQKASRFVQKRAGAGLFAASGIDVHHEKGCRITPDLRRAHFGRKQGKRVKGSFRPLFPMVLRENNTLSITVRQGGPSTFG